ncbi:hypothetical protein G7054_g4457 [Neopestalotiopsis clavispora]|nr:hypothetical protein G7054_g4457 [Neopestalotiopsis clavispora]
MDPLSILSLTSGVIQLIDFSSKLVSKGHKIHNSTNGLLIDFADLSTAAAHLLELNEQLKYSVPGGSRTRQPDPVHAKLFEVCDSCTSVAKELIAAIDQLRVRGRRTKWKSVRQAFKSIYGQHVINEMKERLESHRKVLDTCLLIALKQRFDRKDVDDSKQFRTCANMAPWASVILKTVDSITLPFDGGIKPKDLQRFSDQLTMLVGRTEEEIVAERIVQSLAFQDKDEREFRICEAHRETFEWAYGESPGDGSRTWSNMSQWLESDDDLYWITGKPGSGKSTFVKFLSTNPKTFRFLQTWSGPLPLIVAKFYFWNSGCAEQMSQEGLLQSLLLDILSHDLHHLVPKIFPRRWRVARLLGQDTRHWTLSELRGGFENILAHSQSFKLCLFIDGLDEFEGNHKDLVELFQNVVRRPNIKACLASRPWNIFEDAFSQQPNLQLHHLTFFDVVRFTSSLLHANRFFLQMEQHEPDRSTALIDSVASRALGVFLWVDLAVASLLSGLSNCDRMVDLQRRLDAIPPALEDFYDKMFDSIEDFYYEHACQLFQIASMGKGRLTVLELSFADEEDHNFLLSQTTRPLSSGEMLQRFNVTRRRLNSCCQGFLEIPMPSTSPDAYVDQEGSSTLNRTTTLSTTSRLIDDRRTIMVAGSGHMSPSYTNRQLSSPGSSVHHSGREGGLKVSYLHRTARDFLHSTKILERIYQGSGASFDAATSLFYSSIISLKTFNGPVNSRNKQKLWDLIDQTMKYAAKCEHSTGKPQTQLLHEVDRIVAELTACKVQDDEACVDISTAPAAESHWTSTSRIGRGANHFMDLAAEYDLPLYMLQAVRLALPESAGENPDAHTCLFHVIKDFKDQPGLCEWVGSRIPRISFISSLLEMGANPNHAHNGVTSFEMVLSEAVDVSNDKSVVDKKRSLESWAIIIEMFIGHDANPRANVNSAIGSLIREALANQLPETSRRLEKMIRKSRSRWDAVGKFLIRPFSARDDVAYTLSGSVDGRRRVILDAWPIPDSRFAPDPNPKRNFWSVERHFVEHRFELDKAPRCPGLLPESPSEKVPEPANEPVDERLARPVNERLYESLDESRDMPLDEPANEPVDERLPRLVNKRLARPVNERLARPINERLYGLVDERLAESLVESRDVPLDDSAALYDSQPTSAEDGSWVRSSFHPTTSSDLESPTECFRYVAPSRHVTSVQGPPILRRQKGRRLLRR